MSAPVVDFVLEVRWPGVGTRYYSDAGPVADPGRARGFETAEAALAAGASHPTWSAGVARRRIARPIYAFALDP